MIICYEIVCTERHIEDYGPCSVFGLRAFEEGEMCGEPVCYIEDISSNRHFVESLCDLLRYHDVHPVHIKDIVLDVMG